MTNEVIIYLGGCFIFFQFCRISYLKKELAEKRFSGLQIIARRLNKISPEKKQYIIDGIYQKSIKVYQDGSWLYSLQNGSEINQEFSSVDKAKVEKLEGVGDEQI